MLRAPQVLHSFARTIAGVVLLGGLLLCVAAHAASYVYDANGRLRAVTSSTGASSQYVYDALGNITKIQSLSAGQLAIFAFTPNHGAIGSSVTIVGQGFSSAMNGNTVQFNGTTVTSTTSVATTQLVVVVPNGATTGPVSVTVNGTTVASIDNFIVTTDSGGLPPTITSFTPQVANAGMSVSVTGSHFVSTAGPTTAGVASYSSVVTPTSDTNLSFTVPSPPAPPSGSGAISVVTPYGAAQSSQPLVVVPTSIAAANVLGVVNLPVDSTAQQIAIGTAGKYVAGVFQASSGQWISLQVDTISSAAHVTIYDPSGVSIAPTYDLSSSTSIHLPRLPQTGTYLALFNGDSGNTPSFNVAVESNPLVGTSSVPLAITHGGQTKRVIFAGAVDQLLAINFSSLSFPEPVPPSPSSIYVTPVDPAVSYGDPYWTGQTNIAVFAPETANFRALPHPGLYTAIISQPNSHTMTTNMAMISNPVGSVVAGNQSPFSQSTNVPNENGNFRFDAVAGQNLSFGITSIATNSNPPLVPYIYFGVVDPNGTDMTGGDSLCSLLGCHYGIANAKAGTYSVRVVPGRATNPSTLSYVAWLSIDIAGSLTPNAAYAVNLARNGQIARLTFSGTPGQYYSLYLDSIYTAHGLTITALKPDDGLSLTPSPLNITSPLNPGSGILNLPVLPQQTGSTYTVQVEAYNADTATSNLTLVPDPTNGLTLNGPRASQSTTRPGQAAYLTFVGTVGQTLHLGLSWSGSTQNLLVTVKRANGSTLISNYSCSGSSGCSMPITNIPASNETYTISVLPSTATTMSYTASLTTP